MATRILIDIQNDVKLLITAITGFEEGEEGFRICEAFALSNVKHHRFLSVDGHATKRAISEVVKKFSIHGKYEVSKKFQHLIDTFLTSFDFDHHPQYDLQWTLLSFLLYLSNETNKSELQCLDTVRATRGEHSLDVTNTKENEPTEEIDWGQYLKEGQDNFFHDYRSDSDSEWSDNEEDENLEKVKPTPDIVSNALCNDVVTVIPIKRTQSTLDKLSQSLADRVDSTNWLKRNIQNDWWRSIETNKYPVDSSFPDANFCSVWSEITSSRINQPGTLSEYQVCREILWMFQSPARMALFLENTEAQFAIKQDVSIPSLSRDAFSSMLLPLCDYFAMLRELEQFGDNLYPKANVSEACQRPPLTYEAYHRAVVQYLNRLRQELLQIENKFIEQDGCHTLLSLLTDLRTFLERIKILYEVHQSVTSEWESHLNWKCASKLLSGLFFEMQNSSTREKANMCTSLYLPSLGVYLNIIDTWLSEGRLEDRREEFIITKIPKVVTVEDEKQYDKFIVRQLDPICLNDPIMDLLVHKVCDMGRSIELLVSLDRIPDMWRMLNESNVPKIPLNDEFLLKVVSEFDKYNPTDSADTVDTSAVEIVEIPAIDTIDSAIEENVFQQMSNTNDPFLLKAFEDYVPFAVIMTDMVDGKKNDQKIITNPDFDIFERLQSISQSVLPSLRVLKTILSKILDSRYHGASKLVKDIMVKEYNLEKHLKLMRCVYMMETGHVMNKFFQLLFTEIESNPTWNNPNSLTNILEKILSQEWSETSSRWSIVVHEIRTHQVLAAVDKITLQYAVGWPICMILTEDALAKYNEIFRFQLKLRWGLWTLDHLNFSDLEGSRAARITDRLQHFQARRLESLRFWLIHAIGSIHAYLSGQVLQSLGFMLETALANADSLDTIIRVHNDYLVKVYQHCLQTAEFEDLTATISSLLEMCVHVRDRWKRGAENIIPAELDTMESSYITYHTYLALALHNAVQHKDADYYKLTPQFTSYSEENDDSENSETSMQNIIDEQMTELSRTLLTEVAYQSLPPSGIPISLPKLMIIRKENQTWKDRSLAIQLREQLATHEYEQAFSYLRWHHYEERLKMNTANSNTDSLCNELNEIIQRFEDEEA